MASVGQIVEPTPTREVLSRAQARAALIPDCMVEAQRLANTVIAGWHGRRKRGIGENFWQFRPYVDGESLSRIDWRRSARDDHTYVRDREWEAAHTVWIWADLSPSMMYKSTFATVSKESRALVIMLALAERTGLDDLAELAGAMALAGESGAQVRRSVEASADALTARELADVDARAAARTERMNAPVAFLVIGFVLLVIFPGVYSVVNL